MQIGLSAFANKYNGDLSTFTDGNLFRFTRPGIGIFLQGRPHNMFAFRFELQWNRIFADDFQARTANFEQQESNFRYIRNLHFRNDLIGLNFQAVFYPFAGNDIFIKRKGADFYIMAGVGFVYSNPTAKIPEFQGDGERFSNAGEWAQLQPLGTEGQYSDFHDVKPYSLIHPVFPVAIGVSVKLDEITDLAFEVGQSFVSTDYLDDVSGNYVDKGAFTSELARAMSDRSAELNAMTTQEPRDLTGVTFESYLGVDGNTYTVISGHGAEGNKRGDDKPKDSFVYFSVKFTRVIN